MANQTLTMEAIFEQCAENRMRAGDISAKQYHDIWFCFNQCMLDLLKARKSVVLTEVRESHTTEQCGEQVQVKIITLALRTAQSCSLPACPPS
eukprot:2560736-Rhodomonas_salina.4